MEITSLIIASTLIIIPILISYKEKLGLGKEIIVSMIRAIVQLTLIGYILDLIFGFKSVSFTVLLVLIMMVNASLNTKKRGEGIKNVVFISFVSIFIGSSTTLTVLIISKAINFVPNEIIPIAGMIISNSMVAISLTYKNLNANIKNRKSEIEVKLSLGADIGEASKDIIRDCIKTAIIPSIDSAKTLGIVALPGMMTGLILGGASPIVAIKFQIMVTFMILSSVSIAIIISTYMSYKHFFNERKQINL
ncbi:MAG: iron export ABC transporter permease subunit FetB [Peptostreptococcaceae bacterium]